MQSLIDHLNAHESTVIIAPQKAHPAWLSVLSREKTLFNFTLLTEKDFLSHHKISFKEDALFFLKNQFNLSFENAQTLLSVFKDLSDFNDLPDSLKPYYSFLNETDQIIKKPWSDTPLKSSCVVVGLNVVNPQVMDIGKKYYKDFKIIESIPSLKPVPLYRFIKESDEVKALAIKIVEAIKKGCSVNQIKVHIPSESYHALISVYFKRYHIPYEINDAVSFNQTRQAHIILKFLEQNKPNDEIYDDVFDYFNHHPSIQTRRFASQVLRLLEKPFLMPSYRDHLAYIKYQFSMMKVPRERSKNAVICDDYTGAHFLEDDQVYIIGFNEGVMPKPSLNNRFIDDKTFASLGLETSIQRTQRSSKEALALLNQENICYVSYSLKSLTTEKIMSSLSHALIARHRLVEKTPDEPGNIRYSITQDLFELKNRLDRPKLSKTLDKETVKLYESLNNVTEIPSQNTHKNPTLDDDLVSQLFQKNASISYSKIEDYFKCQFRYLVKHILKVEEPFKERLPLLIGNLYHHALSEIDILPESEEGRLSYYQTLIKDLEAREDTPLSSEESFYLHHLIDDVEMFINHVKTIHAKSIFTPFAYEKKYTASLNGKYLKTMVGIVDKIMSYDDQFLIMDYKSSARTIAFKEYEFGLNSQLPFYMGTVLKETEEFTQAAGFFYQTFDPKTPDYDPSKSLQDAYQDRFKLNGFITYEALKNMDPDYETRSIIKGVKVKKDQSLYKNAPVISQKDMTLLSRWIQDKVSGAVRLIESGSFKINPKGSPKDSPSCKYCEYQAICYKKDDDFVPFTTEDNESLLEMIRMQYDS